VEQRRRGPRISAWAAVRGGNAENTWRPGAEYRLSGLGGARNLLRPVAKYIVNRLLPFRI
jgi:hypothetical protein